MPKQTIQSALIEGLLALGYTQSHTKLSPKYLYFTPPSHLPQRIPNNGKFKPVYIIVGRNGALRRGTSISNSYHLSDTYRLKILEAGPAKRAALQAQQSQAFANL